MAQTKLYNVVLQVDGWACGWQPLTLEKNFVSGKLRDASDEFNKETTTWLQGKENLFWHVESSNIIQHRRTVMSALSVKRIYITALQEKRLQGKEIFDMKSHTFFCSDKEEGAREFAVAFVVNGM